jgi:predicted nucleic acid-binding protein
LIVVSDASPILNLRRIDRLELLGALYGHVLIPPAVLAELSAEAVPGAAPDIAMPSWLTIQTPTDWERVQELRRRLDAGEAEAIVLAIERHADLLLIDERRGRQIAVAAGLRVTGLIGALADAKRAGLIDSVKPVLDDLIQHARFWIGPALYSAVLAELGEA